MMREQEQLQLSGTVEDLTFRRDDTGFTVLDLASNGELVVVVGILPQVQPGDTLTLQGYWDYHTNFGRQFRATACKRQPPTTAEDMRKYLASRAIHGIGPSTARRIVDAFGDQTFAVLEHEPLRLAELSGISINRAKQFSREFKQQFAIRESMIALERFGMSPTEAIAAFRVFGQNAAETIERNPYILCEESIGLSFDRADTICASLPEPPSDNFRIQAGILHVLRHNLGNGHTCLPQDKLIPICVDFLHMTTQTIADTIATLLEQKRLIQQEINGITFLFLPQMYMAEQQVAQRLSVFLQFPPAGHETLEAEVDKLEQQNNIAYEEKQREAILTAVRRGMLILTGGPGTGKTTTLNGILQMLEQTGLRVALAAPTGRAAKRMQEITGQDAKTIHRLLEVAWDQNENQSFARNMENPLDTDAVILDELSMVDITLFCALLDALPLGCRFIMVGDANQLPPVGAGNVLHDLIDSGLLPVVELTQVFRQAMESLIVTNAHRIVQGELPILDIKDRDCFFLPRPNPFLSAKLLCDLAVTRLPKAYQYDPLRDIQVICPSRKGECGTVALNRALQALLNPPEKKKRELPLGGRIFREGDKIMQTRNNYNIEWTSDEKNGAGIFNGDIGIIQSITGTGDGVIIQFDDKRASYAPENLRELEHAYAITVHKSQGNEFEVVLLPVSGVVPQLAYRNLLYTAVTRAKALLILVGDAAQIRHMVENNKKTLRYSALQHFLMQAVSAAPPEQVLLPTIAKSDKKRPAITDF